MTHVVWESTVQPAGPIDGYGVASPRGRARWKARAAARRGKSPARGAAGVAARGAESFPCASEGGLKDLPSAGIFFKRKGLSTTVP